MGKTLYLECDCGISGDMTVAALLDLGADEEVLKQALYSMPVTGFEIEVGRVKKAGLDACDFNVKLDKANENHDHDMEYLHGHEHEHSQEYEHGHSHDHEYSHAHEHRGMPEIKKIIEASDISDNARQTALRIFDILARAEAKAHGVDIKDVHFHEVGAIDSIVDIVAAAVCLDNLGITEVIVPYMCEGRGTVRCQHGILPIPVPAVANIVQMNALNVRITETYGELVTPTGAAIVAAVKSKDRLPKQFSIQKIGVGAGKRNYERPSLLRAMLIEEDAKKEDSVYKMETNIDDCTGEVLGYVMDRLFENGALDVNYMPVFMKKNRPAYLLTVLCAEESVNTLENIIFKETSTIGIRKVKMDRTVLEREMETVDLPVGEIKIKKCMLPDGSIKKYPEYETVAKIAGEKNMSVQEVLDIYKKQDAGKEKLIKLEKYFKELGSAAVAFSGGVDSTFLLKTAHDVLGGNVIAVTANLSSFPKRELDEAKDFCKENGIRHYICETNELEIEGFSDNPPERCYLCKKELFNKIIAIAKEQNINNIVEGSNMDDTGDYRPGLKAIKELGIKSPFKSVGLYREEIEKLSKEFGLPTWDKPSFACLSTRFAYGERITKEKLDMVDRAEQLLLDKGFRQVRVRIHGYIARIEVMPDEFERLISMSEEIAAKFKSYGFTYVSMDLSGYRTGSMNEVLDRSDIVY